MLCILILQPSGRTMTLDEQTGIDILGNILESTIISPNRGYYGDLHNMGHIFISYAHDPDYRHLEQFGVMGDLATTMRDPVFYRWHSYIDDLFQLHKSRLPVYGTDKLDFPGVTVSSVAVEGQAGANTFGTHWEQSTLDLERGLDFAPRGPVLARFTHLQQDPFTYVIECNNATNNNVMGTVRIFMAPRNDEKGQAMPFKDQRLLMIELDKFTQNLRPGSNTIRRNSADSSVTVPYERTFQNQANRPGDAGSTEAAEFDFCGCGWPQHMLVPKGTAQGYPVVLFVMISNWMDDRVEQDTVGTCNDAASYCGLRDRKYPDRRSMGYPFDRVPRSGVSSLSEFLTPNMRVQNCTIRFTDTTTQRTAR
ncbi:Phenoloxidase subunit 1 [Eumeta japonica]|uniref:tyrosinase n=1 Tax=Eumeta variegata TaxID=151549 RepID=A0A4C1U3F6_EUMVA|nr:Phenoloxidase subunit 1 [Eumeta japonica]